MKLLYIFIIFWSFLSHSSEQVKVPSKLNKNDLTITSGRFQRQESLEIIFKNSSKSIYFIRSNKNYFNWRDAKTYCDQFEDFYLIPGSLAFLLRETASIESPLSTPENRNFVKGIISPFDSHQNLFKPFIHFWPEDYHNQKEEMDHIVVLDMEKQSSLMVKPLTPEKRSPFSEKEKLESQVKTWTKFNKKLQQPFQLCLNSNGSVMTQPIDSKCKIKTLSCPLSVKKSHDFFTYHRQADSISHFYPENRVCEDCDDDLQGNTKLFMTNVYYNSGAYLFSPDLGGYCDTHKVSAKWQDHAKTELIKNYKLSIASLLAYNIDNSDSYTVFTLQNYGQEAYCYKEK